ncbi:MAG: DALR anticodon-binding domain-containing protein, partial [Pseudomonadota bacterium]
GRFIDSLHGFLQEEKGQNLLAAYWRSVQILESEEQRDRIKYHGEICCDGDGTSYEDTIVKRLNNIEQQYPKDKNWFDLLPMINDLADLRTPLDDFFDQVRINDPDPDIRRNRLELLALVRHHMHRILDFGELIRAGFGKPASAG